MDSNRWIHLSLNNLRLPKNAHLRRFLVVDTSRVRFVGIEASGEELTTESKRPLKVWGLMKEPFGEIS
jgi:hypothetical protein